MLQHLQSYYADNGILSTSFTCRFASQCSTDCPTFTGPKSAYVPTGYERRDLPRLLFLSLDSGSGEQSDAERLPSAVRRQEEIECDISRLRKQRHWYRTHELAWYILRRFNPALELREAKHHFAHANSAKCCMNNEHRKKASAVLFRNCRRYLAGEFLILLPEIVVTQGSEAKDAMTYGLAQIQRRLDKFAAIAEIEGRKVFWLHTHHPSNYGAFNRQRDFNKKTQTADGWERYSETIFKFISTKG